MSKNIVIVGPASPYRGGIATGNDILAEEFAKHHSVQIVNFTVQYPNFLFPGKTQFLENPAPPPDYNKRLLNSLNPLSWRKIGKQLQKEKPDLIVMRYWMPFFAPSLATIAKIARKNKHTKVIVIADNIIPHESRIGDKKLTNYLVKHVDGFIAMSKSVLKEFNLFNIKHKLYSPHPMFRNYGTRILKKEACKKLALDTNYNYVLFFGLIRDYKGLDLLLKAFNHQYFRENKIKLILAGEYYSKKEFYSTLIQELGIEDLVISFDYFIPDDMVNLFFSVTDLIASPYKSATQSGVAQIAYHFELPMLVTNVGGLPELVPNNKVGYVVEPKVEAIQAKLIQFYKEGKSIEFRQNLAIEKLRFTWDKMVENIFYLEKEIRS
jgi:glycosyltransferase involved in cell wall biosynthesis